MLIMAKDFRINKYIADCTGCSRREAETFILDGKVKVNNTKITDMSTRVKSSDSVTLSGKKLILPSYSYFIFNKPAGYITTREDEKGRKTIYDLLPEKFYNFKPVGRLDKDSSGLLLLTNDGELINLLTHPKFSVSKKYRVWVKGKFAMEEAKRFKDGIDIGEPNKAYAEVNSIIKTPLGTIELILTLTQGYNRQIRRMVEAVGCNVVSLKRLTMGPLTLKGLKRGEYSILSKKEVSNLLKYAHRRLE